MAGRGALVNDGVGDSWMGVLVGVLAVKDGAD